MKNPQANPAVNQQNLAPGMSAGRGAPGIPDNMPLFLQGDGAPNVGLQNPAGTAIASGINPISRPTLLSGYSTEMVHRDSTPRAALPGSMSGAAEQDAGTSIRSSYNLPAGCTQVPISILVYHRRTTPVPAMLGVSEDSEDATSIQSAPRDFLSLGRASDVAASDMEMNPSTLASPVNCDSDHPPANAESAQTGIQADDSQRPSSSSAVVRDSHSKLESVVPANIDETQGQQTKELASLLAEGVTGHTMQIEETPRKAKTQTKKHRPKVIFDDKQVKKQKPTFTPSEVNSPNQKANRSYVRKKRDLNSLEKCSGPDSDQSISGGAENTARSRTASARRRLQYEFGEHIVPGDQSSTGKACHQVKEKLIHVKSVPCSATTILSTSQSEHGQVTMVSKAEQKEYRQHRESGSSLTGSRDFIILRPPTQMIAFCQARGIKKKRSVRVRRSLFFPVMDIAKKNAQALKTLPPSCMEALYESSWVIFMTKKRSQRGVHSPSPIQRNMDKKNMFPSRNSFGATGCLSNCLVPFGSQMIIPYERPLNLFRKQRPRAKVNLDSETTRVWNLLMGKATEPVDGTDVDKERWWQQEREVFQGRANSFIARMRLVQGDRHFSPWKGSVVDSVVGVFLTQNVSDHLSSSAYMALAASFPLGSVDSICKDDNTSQDNEEIGSTSLAGGVSMFDFFDISRRPDLGENLKELSITYEKIHVETKSNTSAYELTEGEKKILYSEEPNEGFCDRQETIINQRAQKCPDLSVELTASIRSPPDIQFQKDMSSSQSVIISETILQSRLFSSSRKNCAGGVIGADSQQLGSNFVGGNSLAGNDATAKELERQRIRTAAVYDDVVGEHGVPSTSMMCYPFVSVDRHVSSTSPNSSSSSASSLLTNGTTAEKLPLFMPSDNHTAQQNCGKTVLSTQNSPKTITDLPVELHGDKSTRFEASVLQEHESLFSTGGMIAETANEVDGFVSYSEVPDKGAQATKPKKTGKTDKKDSEKIDWDKFRRQACDNGYMKERIFERRDSVDWEAVRCADVDRISHAIRSRGMSNVLAHRIQDFLNRLVSDHGSIDLEWLREIPPDSAKEYLLSVRGLGLKSVECVRLLTLHQHAFPVDTNVGRICVRLGWVPIQPLPESLQLHLLELYPVLESIQKYLWPRLCELDQHTLYELHYHMITFGKVFCTKSKPNCNACPLRSECRHFASAFASARLALPAPEEKSLVYSNQFNFRNGGMPNPNSTVLPQLEGSTPGRDFITKNLEPIIEEPESPREEERTETLENDIEDYDADTGEIPEIKLNLEAFAQNLENCIKESNMDLRSDDIAKALVAISPEEASIPVPKLKNVGRLRTEHYVYELPDSHFLVQQQRLDQREPDDPSPYLLTIWMQDDIKEMSKPPKPCCDSQMEAGFFNNQSYQYCDPEREIQSKYVRGTILVPCRTAMKGSFPLNGTYFQVNEVFADHKSSHDPIYVEREKLWNLQRRMVYFGTSVPAIFKGLTTEEIQQCFWRGFICVRGFEREYSTPRPLCPHLHLAASKLPRSRKSAATEENWDSAGASVS